jgi:hypothetical protein
MVPLGLTSMEKAGVGREIEVQWWWSRLKNCLSQPHGGILSSSETFAELSLVWLWWQQGCVLSSARGCSEVTDSWPLPVYLTPAFGAVSPSLNDDLDIASQSPPGCGHSPSSLLYLLLRPKTEESRHTYPFLSSWEWRHVCEDSSAGQVSNW